MKILGLDPSLSSTGWAIVEDGKVKKCGTIKTSKKDGDFINRLMVIRRDLSLNVIEGSFCDMVAIEDVFVNNRNLKTSIQLAKVHGVVLLTTFLGGFWNIGMIRVYAPSFIKQTITSNGNADKEQVIKMVKLMAGYKGNQSDEADAIAVALTCERSIGKNITGEHK